MNSNSVNFSNIKSCEKTPYSVNLFIAGHRPKPKVVFKGLKDRLVSLVGSDNFIIRIEKILEILQYTVLSYFYGLALAMLMNKILPPKTDEEFEKEKTSDMIGMLCLTFVIMAVFVFISIKLLRIIPFLFHFYSKYTPNFKNEAKIGISIGLTVFAFKFQVSLNKRIKILKKRLVHLE